MQLWEALLGFWGEVCIGLVRESTALIMRLFLFFVGNQREAWNSRPIERPGCPRYVSTIH
jgi:hypothetical protein